jgi:hypothetical protein
MYVGGVMRESKVGFLCRVRWQGGFLRLRELDRGSYCR